MWRNNLFIIMMFFNISNAKASEISCPESMKSGTFTFPDVKVILGNNIPDYTVLYSARNKSTTTSTADCSASVDWVMTLDNTSSSNKLPMEPSYNGKTHKIYSTNISGLGISVINAEPSSSSGNKLTVPAWPDTQYEYSRKDGRMGNWFDVYLWKIPGDLLTDGTLDFTGPTLLHMRTPTSSSDTITGPTYKDSRHVIWASAAIAGSLNIQLGTCDMVGGSKTVELGSFSSTNANGGKSAWTDASFSLSCPNAAGYGGYVSGSSTTSNSVKNKPIRIQIVPYTPAIDVTNGILDADVQGYGIQLAWGDLATLGDTPASPVQLNSWVYAYTLNSSAYRSSDYAINSAGINGDGTIKMAARFVRTTGEVEAGPAKAIVEVLASYE